MSSLAAMFASSAIERTPDSDFDHGRDCSPVVCFLRSTYVWILEGVEVAKRSARYCALSKCTQELPDRALQERASRPAGRPRNERDIRCI